MPEDNLTGITPGSSARKNNPAIMTTRGVENLKIPLPLEMISPMDSRKSVKSANANKTRKTPVANAKGESGMRSRPVLGS